MQLKRPPQRTAMAGFSLVELMVASVIGLIVVGAVMALVLSMMRSNRQTLQSTRLNQELRATLAVVASDLKRARGVEDPFTVATSATGNTNEQVVVTNIVASADPTQRIDCLQYSYDGAAGGNGRTIRVNGDNRLEIATGSTSPACNVSGEELGSNQVSISGFAISPTDSTSSTNRRYDITITGSLVDPDTELSSITRTLRQTVFVRSLGDGS